MTPGLRHLSPSASAHMSAEGLDAGACTQACPSPVDFLALAELEDLSSQGWTFPPNPSCKRRTIQPCSNAEVCQPQRIICHACNSLHIRLCRSCMASTAPP